jgi:hypothetical protein
MANAILYYRTSSTTVSTNPNPSSLPSNQKVTFDQKYVRFEALKKNYENNIIDTPSVVSDGTRKTTLQDNGLRTNMYTIQCSIRLDSTEGSNAITNLENMLKRQQVDAKFPFGNIGILTPNTSTFSLDPDATSTTNATRGMAINKIDESWSGREPKTLNLVITLKFGGTLP